MVVSACVYCSAVRVDATPRARARDVDDVVDDVVDVDGRATTWTQNVVRTTQTSEV